MKKKIKLKFTVRLYNSKTMAGVVNIPINVIALKYMITSVRIIFAPELLAIERQRQLAQTF